MKYLVELEKETDGRWVAEVRSLPGAMVYGKTRREALSKVQALALRVLADRLEQCEVSGRPMTVTFAAAS